MFFKYTSIMQSSLNTITFGSKEYSCIICSITYILSLKIHTVKYNNQQFHRYKGEHSGSKIPIY